MALDLQRALSDPLSVDELQWWFFPKARMLTRSSIKVGGGGPALTEPSPDGGGQIDTSARRPVTAWQLTSTWLTDRSSCTCAGMQRLSVDEEEGESKGPYLWNHVQVDKRPHWADHHHHKKEEEKERHANTNETDLNIGRFLSRFYVNRLKARRSCWSARLAPDSVSSHPLRGCLAGCPSGQARWQAAAGLRVPLHEERGQAAGLWLPAGLACGRAAAAGQVPLLRGPALTDGEHHR